MLLLQLLISNQQVQKMLLMALMILLMEPITLVVVRSHINGNHLLMVD
ncbi:hypothetical protein OAQ04_03895 [Flavobacteriaceae bacterium]|nr:hypothetical protein [Flavobacteriaceae bacterium]